ncbi:MAG: hypothetical protein ACREBU_14505 [Nitrososphaera sp.]
MKTLKFECDDRYEAEKLASLLSVQKDNAIWVAGISAIVGNEIVIQLKDRSSHAVMMKNREAVAVLSEFLTRVASGRARIHSSNSAGTIAEIVMD